MRKFVLCAIIALGMAGVANAKVSDDFIKDIVILHKGMEVKVDTQPRLVGDSLKSSIAKAKANPNDEKAQVKAALGCYRMAGYITHHEGSHSGAKAYKLVDLFGSSKKAEAVASDCKVILDAFRKDANAYYYLQKASERYREFN